MTQGYDTARAAAFFNDKLTFTTDPVELDRLIKSGEPITIVDVREPEDFAKTHIPGAINLPRKAWDQAAGLSRENTNVFYCYNQACHLAARACALFAGQGYQVMEMEGGFAAWNNLELTLEHEPLNRTHRPSERLYNPRR
jgi:rhodanese-related sulfurtransferase